MTNEDLRIAVEAMAGEIQEKVGGIREAISMFESTVAEADRKGYVGDLYRTRYTVEGRGAFPMDMLRYAVSWPNDEVDASAIAYSQDEDSYDERYTIRLCKYHRDRSPSLCEERWESKFRWKVINTDEHPIETTRV